MLYTVTLNIGTPAQPQKFLLDTGSSDLWTYCSSVVDSGFNSSKSSTYKFLNNAFSIQYVKGNIKGDWIQDTVTLGDYVIQKQQLGLVHTAPGNEVDEIYGILGVGYTKGESSVGIFYGTEYPNLPKSLFLEKKINRISYSLYLDDVESKSGSILFGGVDTSKYIGQLYTVPITSDRSLQVSCRYEDDTEYFDTVLDSGTSLIYVPDAVFNKIKNKLSAELDPENGVYCLNSIPDSDITFDFSGAKVKVPGKELVLSLELLGGKTTKYKYCLPVLPNSQSSGYNLLGDAFLRSAYVVYDLSQSEISIAQVSYNKDDSNVEVIPATGPIPRSLNAPSPAPTKRCSRFPCIF